MAMMSMPRPRAPATFAGWTAAILFGWALVAAAQAAQGTFVAAYRGAPQNWWPTFLYVGAIYSIWALLSWPIISVVLAVERRVKRWWVRIGAYLLLWPATVYAHVLLFGLIYWPFYRAPHIPTRQAMADIMFVRNFDTNTMLYAALVGLTIAWTRWPRRGALQQRPGSKSDDALEIRNRGRLIRVPLGSIDWIGAAGDYAEVHSGGRALLIEETLASLDERLPSADFARIHRGALIRIDRVCEIEPIGRGDAHVRLTSGEELRLSRRFRGNLSALLAPAQPAD